MRRSWLTSPMGYDPYSSFDTGWIFDRDVYTVTQMKALHMPQDAPPDLFFPAPPPKVMPEYPLL